MRRVKSKHIKYRKVAVPLNNSRALTNRSFCSWNVVPCVKIIKREIGTQMGGKYSNIARCKFHVIMRLYCCTVYTCVYVCVCTLDSVAWVRGVCGGISEAVRLNFDFLKPSSSNLCFRFLFVCLIYPNSMLMIASKPL